MACEDIPRWQEVLIEANCKVCIESFQKLDYTLMKEWPDLTEADLKEIGLAQGIIRRFKKNFHLKWVAPLSEKEQLLEDTRKAQEKFKDQLINEYQPLFKNSIKAISAAKKQRLNIPNVTIQVPNERLYKKVEDIQKNLRRHGIAVEKFCSQSIGKLKGSLEQFTDQNFKGGLDEIDKWYDDAAKNLDEHEKRINELSDQLGGVIQEVVQKTHDKQQELVKWNNSFKSNCGYVLGIAGVALTASVIIMKVAAAAPLLPLLPVVGVAAICGTMYRGYQANTSKQNVNDVERTSGKYEKADKILKGLQASLTDVRLTMNGFRQALAKADVGRKKIRALNGRIEIGLCDFFARNLDPLVKSLEKYSVSATKLVASADKLKFVYNPPETPDDSWCIIC